MQINPRLETLDPILGGRLAIIQPKSGYRFSVDSILLADFVHPRRSDRMLELGAGCGVIAAIIAAVHRPQSIVAVELQPSLAELAVRNADLNRLPDFRVLQADLRADTIEGLSADSFDWVVANPPYRAAGAGRISPDPSRRVARGAAGADLHDFVAASARYVINGGRVAMVFTSVRAAELFAELQAASLEPKRCRFIHPFATSPASAMLVEARKRGGVELKVEPPLILWQSVGVYTEEAAAILTGVRRAGPPRITPTV
jgi:tRNA1Val (adenine37-N6)-methyltransferase